MDKTFFRGKLKALVHYVCSRVRGPDLLGSVKLNKMLWYTDLASFVETGESVTGETYIKKPHGPVASHLASVLDELVQDGVLQISTVSRHGHRQKQYVPLRDPDPSKLGQSDLWLAEQVIDRISEEYTAERISEVSHNRVWSIAADGERIPFEAIYTAEKLEVDESDIQWAQKVTAV